MTQSKHAQNLFAVALSKMEVPQFTESISTGNGWVNFGADNLYPQYLIGLSNKSAKHSSILKHKANMIGGNGWQKMTGTNQLSVQTVSFLKNANSDLDMDDILARISYDYVLHSAIALNIVWSKDRKSIASINYINPSTVRISPADPNSEYPDRQNYFVCDNWAKRNTVKEVLFPGFDTRYRQEASTILYIKETQAANEYYGVPTYLACIDYCELDYELAQYHLNNVKNGFSANVMITIPSAPPPEEQDDEIRRLRRDYEGTDGKKIIFSFADGKDGAPIVQQLNKAQAETLFKDLENTIETNIYQAHQVTNPALFGVFQTGKLDNTSNLVESMAIFQSMYVSLKQRVIEKEINKLAQINGVPDYLFIEKYNLNITPVLKAQDIMFILDSTIGNNQKQAVFESLGYTSDEAIKLCPNNAPTPAAPVKVAPTSTVVKPSTDVPKP